MHQAESLPRPQLRTKPFCLESHGPAFAPCNEHVHNNVSEHQNLVDNTCNAVHVSGNVDFQPMVGSQYESDLAQLHNVFTQSLDSFADAEQVQQLNTMYVQGQVPVRNGNAMANNTNANQNAIANTNANSSTNTGTSSYGNTNTNVSDVNVTHPNLGQGTCSNVDTTAAAANVGHTATTATTCVTGSNAATGMVQSRGPPPLLPIKDSESFGAAGLTTLATTTTQSDLIESMTKLLQAQTQMLAAQAQATTVQTLPPLTRFHGEVKMTITPLIDGSNNLKNELI